MIERTCPYCGKEMTAFTEGQLRNMYNQHLLSKHPDRIEITER